MYSTTSWKLGYSIENTIRHHTQYIILDDFDLFYQALKSFHKYGYVT